MDRIEGSSPENLEELEERKLLGELADHVKEDYIRNRYALRESMHTLQLHSKHFVDVQLVKYPVSCGEKQIFDMAEIMREGLKDIRLSSSASQVTINNSSFTSIKNIFDILKPIQSNEECKPEVILIEGAPGMGKTTLCKEIAYKWAKNQSLVDLKLVFYISLQNANIEKINTLQDFILYFCNFNETAAEFAKQCASILHNRRNHDILVILDGYELYHTDSFLTHIFSHKVFKQSKIIITPQTSVATSKLLDIATVRIEVLGFSDESKKQHIENEFQHSSNKIEALSSYLDRNKNIRGICYVPMIMNIVIQMYKETVELPENELDMYQKIICLILSKITQEDNNKSNNLQSVILLFQDLPEVYKNHIMHLSKVAFNSLQSGKIVFSCADIPEADFPLLYQNFQQLGLLKFMCLGDLVFYHFLHSSIQEFLATCYICFQEPFNLLRSTFFLEEYTNSWIMFENLNNKAFLEILCYSVYCKSSPTAKRLVHQIQSLDVIENFVKLTKHCVKNARNETLQMFCLKTLETKFYNTQCLSNTTDDLSIMNKVGVTRKISWNNIYLSLHYQDDKADTELIECFVIDKNIQENIYSRIASELNVNKDLAALIVNPTALLAYRANNQQIINGFTMANKWITSLIMRCCVLTDEASALISTFIKTSKLKLLNFMGCTFGNSLDKILTSLSQITSLDMIFIGDITITEDMAVLMASVIMSNNKAYILEFTNCNLQHKATISITAALKNISALQTLTFDNCNLSKDAADDLAVALYINQNFKRLRLPNNNLRGGGIAIVSALSQIKTLTELNLKNNLLSEVVIDELSSAIKNNHLLETLNLSGNNLKTNGVIKIAQPLSAISSLKILNLQSNQITEGAADAIAIAILSNPKLEELYLGSNNLAAGVIKIATALQYLTTLKVLDINNNNAPEEAAKELAVAIYNNRLELENLWLANNKFGSSVSLIADTLTKTNTLKDINLVGNCIPEEAAGVIAAMIDSNHSLQDVRLSGNLLMTNGVIKIAHSLSKLSTLKILYISDNKIDDRAADALAAVIVNNNKLDDLFLNDNLFQAGGIKIARALKSISSLTRLEFNNNGLPDSVAEDLAAVFVSNSGLSSIGIMNNDFAANGVIAITQALQRLKRITYVNIYNIPLTEEAIEYLYSMISFNKELKDFYLGKNKCYKNLRSVISIFKNALKLRKLSIQDSNLSEQYAEDLATILANKPLERLDFDNNSLKASGITVIAKSLNGISTLKILSFHNNHITEEGADGIASIIISNCGLTDLYLGKNKLKEGALKIAKALRHITTLQLLDFNDNNIPTIVAGELASAILCNNRLEQLRLRGNMFKTKGIQIMAKSLRCLSTLKLLNFRGNNITEEAVDDIITILLNNQELEHVYLGDNFLHSGVSKIAVAMKQCPSLRTLDFDNNNVPGNASNEIASVISNSSLETLYLRYNTHLSGVVIAQALNEVSTLTCVDLSDNNITGIVADQLATAILRNRSLEDLRFRNNSFKIQELEVFMQSLCNLSSLKSLNFGANQLTEEIAELFSSVIANNSAMKELYLGNNNLQAGIFEITTAIKRRPASCLKILDLGDNSIPERICKELADFFSSSRLEKLYLSYNNLSSSLNVILESLSKINTLKSLYLDSCNLTDAVSDKLGTTLCNNCSLQELQLKNNHFKSTGISVIAKSLNQLSTLKLLNIRNNHVTEEAADVIASVILSNHALEQLSLGDNKMLKGTSKILFSLKSIATLVMLNLNNMNITDEVVDELAAVISNNPLLEYLYLAGNKLLLTGLNVVTRACKKYSKNLKVLDIRCNLVNPATVDNFLLNIGNIYSLEALYIGRLTADNTCMDVISHSHFTLSQSNLFSGDTHKNIGHSILLDVACLAVQRLNFCNLIKYNYDATFTLSFNYVDQSFYDVFQVDNKVKLFENMERERHELSQMDATNIITFLPIIKNLRALDLECSNINEEGAFELAVALKCNNVLNQLWLRDNELGAAGAMFILTSIQHISSLKVLDLSNNNIGYQVADSIAAVIDRNNSLEQLWLDGNALLSKGVARVTRALKCLSTLRTLSLCSNGITDDAADELTAVITSNVFLEDLMLSSNDFHSEGICKIAQSLTKLLRLRKLDLFNNKVTEKAANNLADVISYCYSLQELYLSYNLLGTAGAIKILQALKCKSKLQVLTLSNNNLTNDVVNDLTDVLINNNMFYVLVIGGNSLQTAAAVKIAKTVKNSTAGMRVLDLSDNNVSEQGKDEITMCFSPTTYLQLYV